MSLASKVIATLAAAFAMQAAGAQAEPKLSEQDKLHIVKELLDQKKATEQFYAETVLKPIFENSVFKDGCDFVTAPHIFIYTHPAIAISAYATQNVSPDVALRQYEEGDKRQVDYYKFYANGTDIDAKTFEEAFRVYSPYGGLLTDSRPRVSYMTGFRYILTRETSMLCTWNLDKPSQEKTCTRFDKMDDHEPIKKRILKVLEEYKKPQQRELVFTGCHNSL